MGLLSRSNWPSEARASCFPIAQPVRRKEVVKSPLQRQRTDQALITVPECGRWHHLQRHDTAESTMHPQVIIVALVLDAAEGGNREGIGRSYPV